MSSHGTAMMVTPEPTEPVIFATNSRWTRVSRSRTFMAQVVGARLRATVATKVAPTISQSIFIDEINQRGHRRGAELEFARVDLVDRVFGGVMNIEVALAVGNQPGHGVALGDERADVGTATAGLENEHAVRL